LEKASNSNVYLGTHAERLASTSNQWTNSDVFVEMDEELVYIFFAGRWFLMGTQDVNILTIPDVSIQSSDSPSVDAFGRWRVSNPITLFDSKLLYDKAPLFWSEKLIGLAASGHSVADSMVTMTVMGNGDTAVRQTKTRMNYQPGKSQLVMMTTVFGSPSAATTKRVGAFDANNGLFFEYQNDTIYCVRRKGGVDTKTADADWNLDKLDGTGPSGVVVDWTKSHIIAMDYEWLGVGRVRYGLVIDGLIIYVHQYLNANNFDSTYIATPNLALRYEISSSGGAGSLVHICSSVISEGGSEDNGVIRATSTGNAHLDANVAGTVYGIIGVRLKSTSFDATVKPISLSMIATTNDNFEWLLCINPTVAGSVSWGNYSNSVLQVAYGATANVVSDTGTLIGTGFASAKTLETAAELASALRIGADLNDVADQMWLCVRPLNSNVDIHASLTWREMV
jgi:hypothetical protein